MSLNDAMNTYFTNNPSVAKQASLVNYGSATAPLAGADIVSINVGAGGAGYYRARVTYAFGATAEATAPDNFVLKVNSGIITNLPSTVSVNNDKFGTLEFFLNVAANGTVRVQNIAAGSAGSIYKALLVLDKLG